MMGAGKTTVGRAVEARTGWRYLDNDELVERATGKPTPEVLVEADEATLRRVEDAALAEALATAPPVVAGVAAGVIENDAARERMQREAFVVYLRAPLEVLTARVGDGEGRPWLADDPADALARLAEGRGRLYEDVADLVLDVADASPDDLAEQVVDAVGR